MSKHLIDLKNITKTYDDTTEDTHLQGLDTEYGSDGTIMQCVDGTCNVKHCGNGYMHDEEGNNRS